MLTDYRASMPWSAAIFRRSPNMAPRAPCRRRFRCDAAARPRHPTPPPRARNPTQSRLRAAAATWTLFLCAVSMTIFQKSRCGFRSPLRQAKGIRPCRSPAPRRRQTREPRRRPGSSGDCHVFYAAKPFDGQRRRMKGFVQSHRIIQPATGVSDSPAALDFKFSKTDSRRQAVFVPPPT